MKDIRAQDLASQRPWPYSLQHTGFSLDRCQTERLKLLVVRLLWGVVRMDKKKFLTWMTLGASVMALTIFRKMMRYPGDEYDQGKERPYRPAP